MIECPKCGTGNRDTARFCHNCAAPLVEELICPDCGTGNPSTAKFCLNCAAPLRGQTPAGGLTGMLPANTVLGSRYPIIRKLGRGGMGAVYLVSDSNLTGKHWAVKEMSTAALIDPEEKQISAQTFQQEANLLASLNHENLTRVVDCFQDRGKHFLVMDYVEGQTLREILDRRTEPVSEQQALEWETQICNVLTYLHTQPQPVIFRDLKPDNIMVDQNGRIRLIDFGIARLFKPGKSRDTASFGTAGYAPPEQYGMGQTDARSDIYALGATLHQLLTLRDPAVDPFRFPAVDSLNAQISDHVNEAINRAVHPEPNNRWTSAAEFDQALHPTAPIEGTEVLVSKVDSPMVEVDKTVVVAAEQVGYPGTSRPTVRLVMAASQLSAWKLVLLLIFLVVILAGATYGLMDILEGLYDNWNNIPIFALFGALGYAAYPKRGSVLISHTLLTTTLVATIWFKGGAQGYEPYEFALAVVASGMAMEIWVNLLPLANKGVEGRRWLLEAAWLVIMAVLGTAIFYGVLANLAEEFYKVDWALTLSLSALFGLMGWFLGDLVHQSLLYRQRE